MLTWNLNVTQIIKCNATQENVFRKNTPLINNVKDNGLNFVIIRTLFLLNWYPAESVSKHLQYLLWRCAVLNTFCADITFETQDRNLACGKLIWNIKFSFFFYFILVWTKCLTLLRIDSGLIKLDLICINFNHIHVHKSKPFPSVCNIK